MALVKLLLTGIAFGGLFLALLVLTSLYPEVYVACITVTTISMIYLIKGDYRD